MKKKERRRMKTLIAIPAMEQMFSWTVQCLEKLRRVGECETEFVIRAAVDTARNILAKKALEGGFDRILWIDSDMSFEPDMMERLSADLDAGWDVVTGIYFKRTFPVEPVIYKALDMEKERDRAETYWDYPQDAVFPVAGFGFGGVMMRTDILLSLNEAPFDCYPGMSEDLSFCVRMAEQGNRMACDSRVKLGHCGTILFSEKLYKRPE